MNSCRGSAIVLSMLLLILLSALGMYVVSAPVGSRESVLRHHREAVARNMARAGVNAAIARLPVTGPGGSPYLRRIPVGPNVTGRYSVRSRKVVGGTSVPLGSGFEEYDMVSEGSVTGLPAVGVRVEARIRFRADPGRHSVRILKWEESAPR